MATWYIDYVNGLDANAGTSWGAAFKTITGATTAKGVAGGDTCRIAKSPDPTSLSQNSTWTNLSKTVTLTTAVTTTIDNCETAWTPVAVSNSSGFISPAKEGTNCVINTIQNTTVNSLQAYHALGSVKDFSAYQQISFWYKNSIAIADANRLRVCLCSDAAGVTIVNSASIPAITSSNQWVPLTIDLGTNLGSSIQSIAMYSGSTTISFSQHSIDNVIACKASSAADSLTLTSLISLNTGSEAWFPIQSINGTTILLDNGPQTLSTAGRGYSGATTTGTIWKRETTKTNLVSASSSVVQTTPQAYSFGSSVLYDGGYNTSSSIQDGDTFFDGLSGYGYGIASNYWSNFNKLNMVRYFRGYSIANNAIISITCHTICGAGANGINASNSNGLRLTVTNIVNNTSQGAVLASCTGATLNITNLNSNLGDGMDIAGGMVVNATNIKNNVGSGIWLSGGGAPTSINGASFANNTVTSLAGGFNQITIAKNCSFGDPLDVQTFGSGQNEQFQFWNYNNVAGSCKILSDGVTIVNDTTTVHTAGGQSWKISPTSALRSTTYPAPLNVCSFYCQANVAVTITGWFRRDNAGVTASLAVRGGQLAGISADTSVSMTASPNTWQQLTLGPLTPTEAGVLVAQAWAYGGTTYNVWVTEVVPA